MAVTWEEITDPPILDSTGQDILEALGNIKDVLQPTNVGIDMAVLIPANGWSVNAPYTYTWTNNKVTSECVVKVDYAEGAQNTSPLYIAAEKVAGGVQFTSPVKPTEDIPVTVHILNAAADSVTSISADMVSTTATGAASNVESVLANQNQAIGDLSTLTTTDKSSLVGAANELNSKIAILDKTNIPMSFVSLSGYTQASSPYITESDGYARTAGASCEIKLVRSNRQSEYTISKTISADERSLTYVKKGTMLISNGDSEAQFIPFE